MHSGLECSKARHNATKHSSCFMQCICLKKNFSNSRNALLQTIQFVVLNVIYVGYPSSKSGPFTKPRGMNMNTCFGNFFSVHQLSKQAIVLKVL